MTATVAISVIICTHNPRPNYLRRVLDALRRQTLPMDQWEVLIIDNASRGRLTAATWDLSWHPRARIVREEEIGLSVARMRGMKEAAADILVFVDDDNVLDPDYLMQLLAAFRNDLRDRKSTRLNSSHIQKSRMPSSA